MSESALFSLLIFIWYLHTAFVLLGDVWRVFTAFPPVSFMFIFVSFRGFSCLFLKSGIYTHRAGYLDCVHFRCSRFVLFKT